MALARISLEPPPNIDPTKATLAYDGLAIIRLNRELRDDALLTRQRAVRTLTDYLHNHEHIAEAINEGVVSTLNYLLSDPDVHCRAYTTECFTILCQHELGRNAVVSDNVLQSFSSLLRQIQADIVRLNIHKAIKLVTSSPIGARTAVDEGFIELLTDCARDEVDEIRVLILDTLHHCLGVDTAACLDTGGVKLFTQLLYHPNEEVRSRAAQNILRLCVNPRGKQQALDEETVPALVKLLNDKYSTVKATAAGALALICTTTHGRYTTLNCGAIPYLLKLVDHEDSRVRVDALKVISCLSEMPEGRRILLDHLDVIRPHEVDENAAVRKHARIAVSVITWKP
ncbi:unnamed protein product [Calicophoron daubneyi]|uniref:U-box domain-containing protein n=1 Tax=Calicophoron daubneyi TaxID=300641 RepID=A0AAV2TJR5_CALDB